MVRHSFMNINKVFPVVFGGSLVGAVAMSYGGGHEERARVFDGPELERRLSIGWWDEKWSLGQTSWKRCEAATVLPFAANLASVQQTLKTNPLKENNHAFVPLCGDSKVVPYLAMKGMKVTCVEGSPIALNRLRSEIAKIPEEAQKRITIIEDDLFKAELPAESVDFIYDTGSLVAIDPSMREEYFNVIQKVSKPGAKCFLEVIYRASDITEGPPHHITLDMVKELYQGWSVGMEENAVEKAKQELADGLPYGFPIMGMKRL
eukprot:TRINITY_DN1853_c0_g1_i8.p1 TRINITY_DN1853_c0_g1~~TRINITY_DN1853_c0_g1_i8.p1  ORF type:complete len:271 (+),score=79.16 TRINITY_DN1853_c0_g1_i8:28-813(+)